MTGDPRPEDRATSSGEGPGPDQRARDRAVDGEPPAPDRPSQLEGSGWWAAIKRAAREYQRDKLGDWAAALTYYGVLSIFPGLLVLISLLGLAGREAVDTMINNLAQVAPGQIQDVLTGVAHTMRPDTSTLLALVIGVAAGLWSASGYVGAFIRAANAIYDVPEGRPIWKTLPIRLGVTVVVGVFLVISVVIVVVTGQLADAVGRMIGIGSTAVTVWNIAKWPVLLVIISLILAILYWATPNARQGGFRWLSPGALLAVILWVLASAGFAFYVANFGSYNKTYGTLGGVITFLVWLWISNIAILFGAELDAELARGRAIRAGHPEQEEPFVPLRDTRKLRGRDQASDQE